METPRPIDGGATIKKRRLPCEASDGRPEASWPKICKANQQADYEAAGAKSRRSPHFLNHSVAAQTKNRNF